MALRARPGAHLEPHPSLLGRLLLKLPVSSIECAPGKEAGGGADLLAGPPRRGQHGDARALASDSAHLSVCTPGTLLFLRRPNCTAATETAQGALPQPNPCVHRGLRGIFFLCVSVSPRDVGPARPAPGCLWGTASYRTRLSFLPQWQGLRPSPPHVWGSVACVLSPALCLLQTMERSRCWRLC